MPPERPGLSGEESKAQALLMAMGGAVGEAIDAAVCALLDGDADAARSIVAGDHHFNQLQYRLEEECVTTIALQQPVAGDLRELIADVFVTAELERIADHAADIAAIVPQLTAAPRPPFAEALADLSQQARRMLAEVMTAYAAQDAAAARAVAARDDEVDRAEQSLTEQLSARMCSQPAEVPSCIRLQWVAHHLERIADRVTNIAERTVYLVSGEVVDLNNSSASG